MNKRKIENWLIFCLKMLPFIFLLISAIYIHRHDIESVTVDNYKLEPFVIGDSFNSETLFSSDNFINVPVGSYYFTGVHELGSFTIIIFVNSDNNFICSAFLDAEVIFNLFNFGDSYILGSDNFGEIMPPLTYTLTDIDSTNNYLGTKINEPIIYSNSFDVIFYQFNNYLNNFFGYDFLNFNEFYDWFNHYFFSGNAPLVFNIVFTILIYELFIDLIYLLYSFMTFIVKFTQKWLNGIYNKDW